jgi:hypothetical protein
MSIIGSINRQCSLVVDRIFENRTIRNMTQSKVGRVALCALAGLTVVGGAVAAGLGLAGVLIATSCCPPLRLVVLAGGITSMALGIFSLFVKSPERRRALTQTATNITAIMYLPALPGYALVKAGIDAFERSLNRGHEVVVR